MLKAELTQRLQSLANRLPHDLLGIWLLMPDSIEDLRTLHPFLDDAHPLKAASICRDCSGVWYRGKHYGGDGVGCIPF